MITQIEGRLVAIEDGAAHVRVGDLTYEVLVPAADGMLLAASVGNTMVFHTLHYLEGQGQGSSYWPRLLGFRTVQDRAFFELFTTVKGIGNRKALRALQMPFARVARAIADRDLDTLQSLPEIGKRTAEAICVELKGKIEPFTHARGGSGTSGGGPGGGGTNAGARKPTGAKGAGGPDASATPNRADASIDETGQTVLMANSAVEILVQLGHTRVSARDLVERVLAREDRPATAGDLVTAALR